MGAAAVPLIAAAVAAGTTIYSTEEQSRQARLSRDQQKGALEKQERDLQLRQEEENKISKRDDEQAKKQARAAASGGRQDTILTSPLGVVENAPQYSKTLLGA